MSNESFILHRINHIGMNGTGEASRKADHFLHYIDILCLTGYFPLLLSPPEKNILYDLLYTSHTFATVTAPMRF